MGYWRQSGIDPTPNEAYDAIIPKRWRNDGSKRGVVLCHRYGSDALSYQTGLPEAYTIARRGLPVISCLLGGVSTWGNDTAQTRIGQAWTFLKTNFGVATDKMLLYGGSMGVLAALNYTRNNPSNVAAVAGLLPVIDPDDVHDNDRGGFAASIEAAYTNLAGWNSAEPTHNPNTSANRATHASQSIPMKLWADSADDVCVYSTTQAFATAVGADLVTTGAAGHVFPVAGLDANTVADFLLEHA